MANNRQCMCCDKKYYYCPSCGSDRLKPTWYATFCSETCKELWHILSRYSMGFITKEDAANAIGAFDIKDFTVYRQRVQNGIEEVMCATKPKKSRKSSKKTEEIIQMDSVTEEVQQLAVEAVHEVVNQEE